MSITVTTDALGIATADLPADFVGVPLIADVQPPTGFRDAPDLEVLPVADGETRTVAPFRLVAQQAQLVVSVVDSAGAPLAGVAVVITVKPV